MSLLTGIRATLIALMVFGTVAWHTESMALPILEGRQRDRQHHWERDGHLSGTHRAHIERSLSQ